MAKLARNFAISLPLLMLTLAAACQEDCELDPVSVGPPVCYSGTTECSRSIDCCSGNCSSAGSCVCSDEGDYCRDDAGCCAGSCDLENETCLPQSHGGGGQGADGGGGTGAGGAAMSSGGGGTGTVSTGGGGSGGAGGADAYCPDGIALANPSFEAPVLAPGSSVAPPGWTITTSMPVIFFPTSRLTQTDPLASPADGNQVLNAVGSYSHLQLDTGVTTAMGASYTMKFVAARPTGSLPFLNGHLGTTSSSQYYQFAAAELPEGTWATFEVDYTATQGGEPLFFRTGNDDTNGGDVYIDNLCLTSP